MHTQKERKARHVLSPGDEQIAVSLYEDGVSAKDIADSIDVTVDTVYKLLRRKGLQSHSNMTGAPHTRLSDVEKKRLIKDYDNGMKIMDLMSKYEICIRTLYNILNDHRKVGHTTRRGNCRLTEDQRQGIICDYKDGIRLKDICDTYDVTGRTVYSVIKKENIHLRGRQFDKKENSNGFPYRDPVDNSLMYFKTIQEVKNHAMKRLCEVIFNVPQDEAIEA